MRPIKKWKIYLAKLLDGIGHILFLHRKNKINISIDPSAIQSILVLELYNIGDVILSLPSLHELRRLCPTAKITFLGGPWAKEILSSTKDINEIITLPVPWVSKNASWKQALKKIIELKKRNFDLALDLRGDFRNIIFLYLTGAKHRIASASTGGGFLLTCIVTDPPHPEHDIEHKLNVIRTIGKVSDIPEFKFPMSPSILNFAENDLITKGIDKSDFIIGIHPGGRWYGRRWNPERFARVIDAIGNKFHIKFLLVGGPEDKEIISQIVHQAKLKTIQIFPTLEKLSGYIAQCNLFLCNESGPMHMAAAIGIPVIALFGPNSPDILGPYGNHHIILMSPDVPCRPCGQTKCIRPNEWCMDLISIQQVVESIEKHLQNHKVEMI